MQQSTKQRIVGTVVLLALALIFLPIIFDGQGSYQTPVSSRIPEPPEVPVLAEPIPQRPVIIADSLAPAATDSNADEASEAPIDSAAEPEAPAGSVVVAIDEAEMTAEATAKATPEATTDAGAEVVTSEPAFSREVPRLTDSGLPQGWSVRLGSFADAANAANLLQRLQDAGYRAYTRDIPRSDGNLTGVFVGPWVDRARVSEYQQALQNEFQLAGIVVPYEI